MDDLADTRNMILWWIERVLRKNAKKEKKRVEKLEKVSKKKKIITI